MTVFLHAARDAVDVSDGQAGNVTQIKDTAKSPFSGGWPATASIAAVLIITVILVPLINQESGVSSKRACCYARRETISEVSRVYQIESMMALLK